MKCEKLFNTIDELYEEYVRVWEDVCNLESPTEYKYGVDEVGAYFIRMAEKHGWKVEVYEQASVGNVVCITMNHDSSESPITLSGHIDTVHAVGSFGAPAVRIDENNIYGPGVMDCKGGVVAAFLAIDALSRCDFKKRPVRLMLQTDEECNSSLSGKETIRHICRTSEGSVAFLNCESSRRGTLVLERKGIIRYQFDICGKEIHSSRCPEGASAIADAAYKIIQLEKLKDADGITCNCGTINGGTAANTVPGCCSFVADIRFSTREELGWIEKYIKEVSETCAVPGCRCSVKQVSYRPAMEKTDANTSLFDRMNEIYLQTGLDVLKARKSLGGSDAADVTEHGIPCVDSIGVEGNYIHTTREYAVLKSLAEAAKRIAVIAYCI